MNNADNKHIHRSIRPLLKKVGLDAKQVEAYLALLSLKTAKASVVAKLAKQSRSHAYIILRDLEAMGLVSEIEEGGVLKFIAESPEKILHYLKDREKELSNVRSLVEGAMPVLQSLTSDYISAPRVTVLKGLGGMKQVYRDILTNEFVGIYNAQTSLDMFNDNIVTMLFGKGAQLKGRDLIVRNEGAIQYCKDVPENKNYTLRILPEGTTFETDTIVYGDSVTMFAFDDEKTIIRIENKKMADSFRAWFNLMWNISTTA